MPRVKVTRSRKSGARGLVIGLYGPSIGYHSAEDVMNHIHDGSIKYYVREGSWEADIRVVREDGVPKLESTTDVLSRNHLHNLPDC